MSKNKNCALTRHKMLYALLFCLFSLSMAAQNKNNITLDMKDKPLREVLAAITKATDYKFVYSDALKEIDQPVTIKCVDQNLVSVLNQLFKDKKISYKIEGRNIALSPATIAIMTPQEKTTQLIISGVVVDEAGDPIPGVTVRNKNNNKIASTDPNGKFQIEAKEGDILLLTSIGMENKEVRVGKSNNLNIVLTPSVILLENVVVTGYQDLPKEKVTGAIATISSTKIEERYTPNIMNNLEGRIAGLSTYGGKTTIRGTSSLYATTNPLLVVDGMPVEGRIEDLNPYDIESVNVLKDAASAAIYGARASNGIIVVTTKSAKKKGVIDIDFSTNFTVYEKKNMNYSDNFYMNAEQQVKVESDYYEYYFFNNEGEVSDPIGSTRSSIESGIDPISPIQYAYYRLATGAITRDQLNSTLNALKKNNFAKEYGGNIYRRQILQQYNLSLRSKTDKFQSNLTLNYKTDNSGIINAEQNLFNINYKGSYDIAPWLTATFNINGIYGKNKEVGQDYNASYTVPWNPWDIPAYERMYNDDGTANLLYYSYSGNQYWSSKGAEGFYDLGVNIKDEFYNNVQTTDRQHMRYHGNLLFKIIKGLTANVQYIYENEHTTTSWYANEKSHVARSIRNAYTIVENGKISYLTPRSGGMLRTTNTDGKYWTARGQIDYSNTFGKHSVTALAGLEFRQTKYNGTKSLVLGYDDQLQNSSTHTVDFGSLSTMVNNPYYMSSAGGYPSGQLAFDLYFRDGMGVIVEQLHRYASGYANITYTYDTKYNLFGSFRKDYADVYGLNAKFRGKPLWSVGAGWNIHNEPFMKSYTWINFLKLRANYGVTGNIYQGATSYMTATSTGMNEYTNLPYGEVESPANPNLKWEKTITTNIGVDYSLINNRLRGSLDLYNKAGKDIFSNKSLDPSTGFTSMFVNMARMRNRGVELAITYDWFRERKRDDFSWTTSLTSSYNNNKITSVENPATLSYQLIDNPYKTGYPSSALWSYRFAGISNEEGHKGETLWYSDNGVISHSVQSGSADIMEYSGQTEPKVVMGMDNRFTWKGFSLNFLMVYYGGHKMIALAEREIFDVSYSAIPSYFLKAWTPENPTNTPGIGRYGSSSTGIEPTYANIAVRDASFLKIRNIVFGYELPEKFLKNIGINRVSLRFQIDNPKYLWVKNKVGVDPETLGIRNPSSYIFGLNINL